MPQIMLHLIKYNFLPSSTGLRFRRRHLLLCTYKSIVGEECWIHNFSSVPSGMDGGVVRSFVLLLGLLLLGYIQFSSALLTPPLSGDFQSA